MCVCVCVCLVVFLLCQVSLTSIYCYDNKVNIYKRDKHLACIQAACKAYLLPYSFVQILYICKVVILNPVAAGSIFRVAIE